MRHRIAAIETFIEGHWLFVVVTTETGFSGFGECTYFPSARAAQLLIEEVAPHYMGEDAFRPEFLFQRAYKHNCLPDAAMTGALSALDQALWDIKGKALGVPVWELLGGRVRDRVRAILLIEATSHAEMFSQAAAAVAEGFTAIKIKPFVEGWSRLPRGRMMREVIAAIMALRDQLGWDVDIAIEAHRCLTPDQVAEFAAGVAPMRPYFIEDPILPFAIASNVAAARMMGGTVAMAERATNIWEFRQYSDSHDVAILRPDAGMAGGFSQLRKIAAIAESRHQRIVPHNFTSPLITAAHVQLAAAMPSWDVQGYVREAREPWNRVVTAVNRIADGYLAIPEEPGIGITLDLDYLRTATASPFGNKFGHGAALAPDGGVRQL